MNQLAIADVSDMRFGNIMFVICHLLQKYDKIKLISSSKYLYSAEFNDFYTLFNLYKYVEIDNDSPIYDTYDIIGTEDVLKYIDLNTITNIDHFLFLGYFQYLPKASIIQLFKNEIKNKIEINDYVVINVRRGDFKIKKNNEIHPIFQEDYYITAMDYFDQSEKFLFVSDDIEWCKKHFKGPNIYYHEHISAIDDFKLLLGAKSLIISNSTFSYFGALFNVNDNSDQKIICNKYWYTDSSNLNDHYKLLFDESLNWIILNYKYNQKLDMHVDTIFIVHESNLIDRDNCINQQLMFYDLEDDAKHLFHVSIKDALSIIDTKKSFCIISNEANLINDFTIIHTYFENLPDDWDIVILDYSLNMNSDNLWMKLNTYDINIIYTSKALLIRSKEIINNINNLNIYISNLSLCVNYKNINMNNELKSSI